MGSSLASARQPLCWLVLVVTISLSGCSSQIQSAHWWKPRELSQTASRRSAPATLINQIQSAEPDSVETVASSLQRSGDDRSTLGQNSPLMQVGHSAGSFSSGQSRLPAGDAVESLDRKLNQVLIEITRLEELLIALSASRQSAVPTRPELSAIQRKLDRLLLQPVGVQTAVAVTESLAASRLEVQQPGRDELLFGPGAQRVTHGPGREPERREASQAQLTAIDGKLDRILDQIVASRHSVVGTAQGQYDPRQVVAIEQKLNRILVTLGQALAPPRELPAR